MIAVEVLHSLYEAMDKNRFILRDNQREEVVSFTLERMEQEAKEFGEWLARKMWTYSYHDKKWTTVNGAEARNTDELYRMFHGEQLKEFNRKVNFEEYCTQYRQL